MTRNRNRRLADLAGLRMRVTAIECPDLARPKVRIVTLSCGHRVRFASFPAPKRLQCPVCAARKVQQVSADR